MPEFEASAMPERCGSIGATMRGHARCMIVPRRPLASLVLAAGMLAAAAAPAQVPAAAVPSPSPAPAPAPASPAGAAPPSPVPTTQLPAIEVTGASARNERIESTTTKIVVNHDEIVRYGDGTLSDVLRRLPGITVTGTQIRMRGLGAGYTQILLDGEPAPAGFSLDSLAPDLIERIEIVRVPTADRSTQAIAGTINIVLRKKVTRRVRTVKITAGAYGGRPTGRVDANLSDTAGALGYGLGVAVSRWRPDDDWVEEQVARDAAGALLTSWARFGTDRGTVDSITLTPRATWTLGPGTLTGDLYVRQQRYRAQFLERTDTLFGSPPAYARDVLDLVRDDTSMRGRVEWKQQWDNGASLTARAGADYARRRSDARFLAFDAADVFVLDRTVDSGIREVAWVTNGKYLLPVLAGHVAALGWDTQWNDRTEFRRQHDVSPAGLPPFDLDEDYDTRVTRLAAFAQDEWDITPRWSAYVGARWESLDTRVSGNVIDTARNHSSVLSPIVQTLWRLPGKRQDQVRVGLSRTYKAPTTTQLTPRRYIANNNTVATPDFEGNPELRPELAWGIDAAYERRFGDDGLFSLSAYARRIDDVILEQLFLRDGLWILTYANGGEADVQGIEAELRGNLRSWLADAPDVRLRANVGRNWSRVHAVPGPDNRLDQQSPWTGSIGLDHTLASAPLTIGASFSFRSGGHVRVSEQRSERLSPRRVLDAYALWKLAPGTQVRLSVADVLRQTRVNGVDYADASGSTSLTRRSQPRLSVRAALELAF
jgi:outer membrane receptor protein involved in Fe transport